MEVKIFWCRFNKYYAQKWLKNLWDKKNAILIASCAVTDNAKRKFMKEIKQQAKKWKNIFLTGCWAFSKNWEVDPAWFYTTYPSLLPYKDNITLLPEDTKEKNTSISLYTKWFIIVQLGCDSHCTFCITVKKRWKHKNKDVNEVIKEIKELEKKWIKEVVLTWINLAAWWMQNTLTWPNQVFPKYLKQILDNTDIPRIRISSIWPEFIEDSWFEILENERILPYFHLSIQSWSDKILKAMWRHYDKKHLEYVLDKLQNLKKTVPINLWADIIVWFPGETEEDFNQTLSLCEKYITKLHVFPFSAHQIWDTVPAWRFEWQIDFKKKKEREQKLIKICDENHKKLEEKTKWKKVKVLIENDNNWWTENYIKYESKRQLTSWNIFETIY